MEKILRYATHTQVSEDRSRIQIERMVLKYGAEEFGTLIKKTEALVGFKYKNIRVEMAVPLPDKNDKRFSTTPAGRKRRSEAQAFTEWEREVRRRWRSLCLVIKALLVGVDDGVLTFEQAFMPYIVIGGQTIGQRFLPQIVKAIESGKELTSIKQLMMLP